MKLSLREMKTEALLPENTTLRSSKYLNNLIEQDHRHVRINTMLGFKGVRNASIAFSGIELMHRIHKGQFDLPAKASKMPLRLWSGTPSSQHDDEVTANLPSLALSPNLHQNRSTDAGS